MGAPGEPEITTRGIVPIPGCSIYEALEGLDLLLGSQCAGARTIDAYNHRLRTHH